MIESTQPATPQPKPAPYIPPAKVAVYLMSYRQQPNRFQQHWVDFVRSKGYAVRYGAEDYGIDVNREHNCNRFLADDVPAGREYIIQIDADIVPIFESDGILRDNGPVVYCGQCGHDASKGHFGDDSFGAGFCRIHKSVLEKIAKPWWKMVFENDRRVVCECSFFRKKAMDAGFLPKMVGIAGHLISMIAVAKTKTEVQILTERALTDQFRKAAAARKGAAGKKGQPAPSKAIYGGSAPLQGTPLSSLPGQVLYSTYDLGSLTTTPASAPASAAGLAPEPTPTPAAPMADVSADSQPTATDPAPGKPASGEPEKS